MKRFALLLLMLLLPIMVACGGSKTEDDEETVKDKKKPLPICPQVAIVHELDTLRDYGSEKPDPSQLVAVSRMEKVTGDCGYQKGGIDITFDLDLIAARGPRLGGDRNSFPFFIAVVDPDQNVIDKNRLTTEFKFGDDNKNVDKVEHLHVFVPLAKDKRETGPNYQILLGFQLTEAQLEAVRDRKAKEPKQKTPIEPPPSSPPPDITSKPDQTSIDPNKDKHILKLPSGMSDQETPDQPATPAP